MTERVGLFSHSVDSHPSNQFQPVAAQHHRVSSSTQKMMMMKKMMRMIQMTTMTMTTMLRWKGECGMCHQN